MYNKVIWKYIIHIMKNFTLYQWTIKWLINQVWLDLRESTMWVQITRELYFCWYLSSELCHFCKYIINVNIQCKFESQLIFVLTWLILAGLLTFVLSLSEIRDTRRSCIICEKKKTTPSDLLSHLQSDPVN